jgi:hypothetical protein
MIVTDFTNEFYPCPKPGKCPKSPDKSGQKQPKTGLKKKSKKLAKLEKDRFSIITKELDICYMCNTTKKEDLHELIEGKNRQLSMKYGLVIPICRKCHIKVTNDKTLQEKLHKVAQKKFKNHYKNENFVQIFGKNYL